MAAPRPAPTFRYRTVASAASPPGRDLPPMQHAASIIVLPGGAALTVWYAASYETAPDAVVVRSLFTPATGWTAPEAVLQVPGFSLGNPVVWAPGQPTASARGRRGRERLQLYLALLPGQAWTSARVASLVSSDRGASWSDLRFLSAFPGLMTKGRPLAVDGRLLLPVYDERTFAPMVLLSDDAGRSWQLVGETTSRGSAIQPVLAETPHGLLMLCRSRQGRLLRSRSRDSGRSWTASQPTNLPNPNSGIDLLRLLDGRLCLVYNPQASDRTRLALAFSEDHGETWSEPVTIQASTGEVSYPSLAQGAHGTVHIVYTVDRTSIVHASFDAPP